MVKPTKPPSQTWRTFLKNHVGQLAAIDFFVVPTVTFRLLYGFVVLRHDRRQVVHFDVTQHPTAQWVGQQLREAFPFDEAPRYLIRDRDGIYGDLVRECLINMGINEVVTAPHSPWQNPFVERLIGSIRRECLDHVTSTRPISNGWCRLTSITIIPAGRICPLTAIHPSTAKSNRRTRER